jgi:hypothetical protein
MLINPLPTTYLKMTSAAARKLGSGSGSGCVTRLIIKSSVAADSCDRSTVVPMRECLLENMILRRSDRIPE